MVLNDPRVLWQNTCCLTSSATENCLLFLAVVEDDDGEWDDDWDDQSVDVYQGEEGAEASGQGSHGPSVMISLNKWVPILSAKL